MRSSRCRWQSLNKRAGCRTVAVLSFVKLPAPRLHFVCARLERGIRRIRYSRVSCLGASQLIQWWCLSLCFICKSNHKETLNYIACQVIYFLHGNEQTALAVRTGNDPAIKLSSSITPPKLRVWLGYENPYELITSTNFKAEKIRFLELAKRVFKPGIFLTPSLFEKKLFRGLLGGSSI